MTKEDAVKLSGDEAAFNKFCYTFVHFKGQFLQPRGGYKIEETDRKNTRYCVLKIAAASAPNRE